MKKILILIVLGLFISTGIHAQKQKRTSAYMYNKNKQYDKAMLAINEAIVHPKTESDAKTWMYRGIIYFNIAIDTSAAIQALAPNAAEISLESFTKSKELDARGDHNGETAMYLLNLTNIFYQKGADAFTAKEFEAAIKDFEKAYNIAQMDDRFDTIAAFNIGMSGVNSKQPKIASEYLSKCIEVGYKNPSVYLYYSRAEKQIGDTTKAFEILADARVEFPDEKSLQLEEAQLFLETGAHDKLINSLKESIAADPTNSNLYRILGQTYENTGDEDNALIYYKEAVAIKPDFGDAIFNIGAIYVNRASVLYAEAANLPFEETVKYEELKEAADENLKEALPYLEKSLSLNPEDNIVIGALNETYRNLKMNDELLVLLPNLERAYEANPDDSQLKGALIQTYKILKMTDKYKALIGN